MNLSKLALALGMAESAPESEIFAKAASVVTEGAQAKEKFTKLSTEHSALVAEVEKQGFKVEGVKLSRLEPVSLSLEAKPEDDDEKKALKAALLAAEKTALSTGVSTNKEFVKKLAADMKMPPALMSLAEEVLSVRGELEAVCLSKDGNIELTKTKNFPAKVKSLLEQLATFKGVKFSTQSETPATDEAKAKAEREKLAKDMLSRAQPEAAAAK